jgi:hypothetical protein
VRLDSEGCDGRKNLVLEITENESAAELQTRLDRAGADGFFLVNVVGRFAFLRTSVSQPKPSPVVMAEMPVNEDAVAAIRTAVNRCKLSVLTLQELRVRGAFNNFPEKEWYAALAKLESDGAFEMRKNVTPGGKTRMIVVKASHG